MYCGQCGFKLYDGAQFCSSCGIRATDQPQQTMDQPGYSNYYEQTDQQHTIPLYITQPTFKELRHNAWKQIYGFKAIYWCVNILWGLLIGALDSFLFGFASFLLGGPSQYGLISNHKEVFNGGTGTIERGFSGFSKFGESMAVYLLQVLYIFLWTLLFIIPGIIKSFSYAMSMYILVDNPNKGANECITESRQMMNGNKWRMFCYTLYFSLLMLLSVIFTLGIGLIWVMPHQEQTMYNFYQSIKSKSCTTDSNQVYF